MSDAEPIRRSPRFHGRLDADQPCSIPGCDQAGEFRAPDPTGPRPGFDGPGRWRRLCLDHVREFNSGYNYFAGMSTDEIEAEQRPYAGWERETRAFSSNPNTGPRWADFVDPLDAVAARFKVRPEAMRADGKPLSGAERKALDVLGLDHDADRRALRSRYAELVRRFHPDRNGGDRSQEKRLQEVIAAYTRLKSAPAFA